MTRLTFLLLVILSQLTTVTTPEVLWVENSLFCSVYDEDDLDFGGVVVKFPRNVSPSVPLNDFRVVIPFATFCTTFEKIH